MEIKPLHIVIALAIVFVALLAVSAGPPVAPPGPDYAEQAQGVYLKGTAFGENATSYAYSYVEYSNGFAQNYTLESDGNVSFVEVSSPLSDKRLYFLPRDTIVCVKFLNDEACASMENESGAQSFLAAERSRLFDNGAIATNRQNGAYMINRSMLRFSPELKDVVLQNGRECTQIKYTIDYSNATLADMERLGIGAGTPKLFQVTSCIGAEGVIYDFSYNTTLQGMPYTYRSVLAKIDFNTTPAISVPNASGNALDLAFSESEYRSSLVKCYQDEGTKAGCIAKIALQLESVGLCTLAGARQDQCMVSIVPLTRDPAICPNIATPEFRDDCYIELGGAYKNATWCDSVKDATKKDFCLQVSVPQQPEPPESEGQNATEGTSAITQNASGDGSGALPTDVTAIFGWEELPPGRGNSSNSTGTGNSTDANGTG